MGTPGPDEGVGQKVADLEHKVIREKQILAGAQTLRPQIFDPVLVAQCDQTIRDALARIQYLEGEKDRLLRRRTRSNTAPVDAGPSNPPTAANTAPPSNYRSDSPEDGTTAQHPLYPQTRGRDGTVAVAGGGEAGDARRPRDPSAPAAGRSTPPPRDRSPDRPLGEGKQHGSGSMLSFLGLGKKSRTSSRDELSRMDGPLAGPREAPPATNGVNVNVKEPLPELVFARSGESRDLVTALDYWKPSTPLTHSKISRRRGQVHDKLAVELKVRSGTERLKETLAKPGDAQARALLEEVNEKLAASGGRVQVLQTAARRYDGLWVDRGGEDGNGEEDPDSAIAPGTRRTMPGRLHLTVHALQSVPGRKSASTPLFAALRLDNNSRARTESSATGRWSNDPLVVDVDRDAELEVAVCEQGKPHPTVLALAWFRLSDVEAEGRRLAMGGGAGQPVVPKPTGVEPRDDRGLSPEEAAANSAVRRESVHRVEEEGKERSFSTWLEMEPGGQVLVEMRFVPDPSRKRVPRPRPDGGATPAGALQRARPVRKQFLRRGHKFQPQQFYQIMRCAACGEFLVGGGGYQCAQCKYTCHKTCHEKVLSNCMSKTEAEQPEEAEPESVAMMKHRIPHRFDATATFTPTWCVHCGQMLPLGRRTTRKCGECGIWAHEHCSKQVPNFCGLDTHVAMAMMQEIEKAERDKARKLRDEEERRRRKEEQAEVERRAAGPDTSQLPQYAPPVPLGYAASSPAQSAQSLDLRIPPSGQTATPPPADKRGHSRRPKPLPSVPQDITSSAPEMPPPRMESAAYGRRFVESEIVPAKPPAEPDRVLAKRESSGDLLGRGDRRKSSGVDLMAEMPDSTLEFLRQPRREEPAVDARANGAGAAGKLDVENRRKSQSDLDKKPEKLRKAEVEKPRKSSVDITEPEVRSEYPLAAAVSQVAPRPEAPPAVPMKPPTPTPVLVQPPPRQPSPPKPLPQESSPVMTEPPPSMLGDRAAGKMPASRGDSQPALQTASASKATATSSSSSVTMTPAVAVSSPARKPAAATASSSKPVAASRPQVSLEDFHFIAVLGKGNFGKVMLAEEKASGNMYAIKVLKKEFIIENDEVESIRSEKRVFLIANKARHPFLVNLHSCFQTETRVYFVEEFVRGGDLMWHIQRQQFSERRARFYAVEVLLALEHLHLNGIVYRDLKLDNLLLTQEGHVKIADYGLCKENMWYGSNTNTFCGTPEFMAPEILLEKPYGRAVDWWALGVLIYEMLLGQSPFHGDDEEEIFSAILEDEILYPTNMAKDAVHLLQKLLTKDPAKRLGAGKADAEEVKRHPFFKGVDWEGMLALKYPPPFVPQIKSNRDFSNFDEEFTKEQPVLTPTNSVLTSTEQEEFRGFTHVSEWAMESKQQKGRAPGVPGR